MKCVTTWILENCTLWIFDNFVMIVFHFSGPKIESTVATVLYVSIDHLQSGSALVLALKPSEFSSVLAARRHICRNEGSFGWDSNQLS